ncbi:hypothetical protein AURDEDRAFT_165862 [Auricularia subglabra TFB-10046 SS5]|nr:hypothetical protein AURDEDRAFT_165862 [Auricularia subglabra TFB-10046 SS5]
MSLQSQLPQELAPSLVQLFTKAIENPDVYNSEFLLIDKIAAIRLCVDNAITVVLTARNDDLGGPTAARCRKIFWSRWRATAVNTSSLWTTLDVYAIPPPPPPPPCFWNLLALAPSEPLDYHSIPLLTNMAVMHNVLPYSKDKALTIKITLLLHDVPQWIVSDLETFLRLASPRVDSLHIDTLDKAMIGTFFTYNDWNFPTLRELFISFSEFGDPYADDDNPYIVDFSRTHVPRLISFSLPRCFRLRNPPTAPDLMAFNGGAADLSDMAALVQSPAGLQFLTWENQPSYFIPDHGQEPLLLQLLDALDTIPDVCISTYLDDDAEERIFQLFRDSLCQRLVLEFDCYYSPHAVEIEPCDWMATAKYLVIQGSKDEMMELIFMDALDRMTTIRLFKRKSDAVQWTIWSLRVEWESVWTLRSLTHLRVDAAVWSSAMLTFPETPLLEIITLRITGPESLDELLGPEDADKRRAWSLPPVPADTTLTVFSDEPLEINYSRMQELKTRLDANDVSLEGVLTVT